MQTYICLLRGINVSGHKKIKMANLKSSFEELGFSNVTTYIQSGNIIFHSAENNPIALEDLVHKMLLDQFGFDIAVIIFTPNYLEKVIAENPFYKDKTKDEKKFYVLFLKDNPLAEQIDHLATYDYSPEEYILVDKLIYYYAAIGAGKAKMSTNFFENKLKVSATARNWRTVNKLLDLSK